MHEQPQIEIILLQEMAEFVEQLGMGGLDRPRCGRWVFRVLTVEVPIERRIEQGATGMSRSVGGGYLLATYFLPGT